MVAQAMPMADDVGSRSAKLWEDVKRGIGFCFFWVAWCCMYLSVLACLVAVTFLVSWNNEAIDAAKAVPTNNTEGRL